MNCTGQLPLPRYGHSAHIVGSRMFIIGGKGPSGAIYNDVYFLDLVEWIWVPVATLSQGPSARLNQASTLVGRKIVIHGGWNGRTFFNDCGFLILIVLVGCNQRQLDLLPPPGMATR